jgi:hypothetical protein
MHKDRAKYKSTRTKSYSTASGRQLVIGPFLYPRSVAAEYDCTPAKIDAVHESYPSAQLHSNGSYDELALLVA